MNKFRDILVANSRRARRAVIAEGLITGLACGAGSIFLPLPVWLPVSGITAVYAALDLRTMLRVKSALRVYDTNPAAAYVIEMRHAFMSPGSTSSN